MNTDQIEKDIKSRFDLTREKQILKEKYQAKMIFAHGDGMWKAGPELLVLLQSCMLEDTVVLIDLYDNPIKVNPRELQQLAFGRWQEQMNAWEVEFSLLRNNR